MDELVEKVIEKLLAERQEIIESLSRGCASDFSMYKYICGQIEGIDTAVELMRKQLVLMVTGTQEQGESNGSGSGIY